MKDSIENPEILNIELHQTLEQTAHEFHEQYDVPDPFKHFISDFLMEIHAAYVKLQVQIIQLKGRESKPINPPRVRISYEEELCYILDRFSFEAIQNYRWFLNDSGSTLPNLELGKLNALLSTLQSTLGLFNKMFSMTRKEYDPSFQEEVNDSFGALMCEKQYGIRPDNK